MNANEREYPWPMVSLGSVLEQYREYIDKPESRVYKKLSVKLYGKGVVLDAPADGANLRMKKHQIARAGQVILSEIWGKKGAIGFVPPEGEGALCTSHFFLFDIRPDKAIHGWLDAIFRSNFLASSLDAEAHGTTGYAAIRPNQFLSMEIPLPPLPEQKRIVAKVQSLTSKIDEARELREQCATRNAALCAAAEMRLWPDTCLTDAPTLEDVTTVLSRGRQSEQGESEHYLIKTQHVQMGHYRETDLRLSDRAASRVSDELLVQRDDILIACSAAGCLGRVAWCNETRTASCDTHVAIARPDPARVLPEYLYAYLRGAQGQYQLRSREKGDWQREKIGFRLTELNVNDMRRVPVFVPDMGTQKRLVSASAALYRQIDDLNSRATDTERMLDALSPSVLDSAFKGEL